MADVGYRATLPRSVVARIAPQQTGAGAAIAEGVATLGKTVLNVTYANRETDQRISESQQRIAEIQQGRDRAAAVVDGMGRLTELQLQTATDAQALRDETDPGAPGYAAKAEELYRSRWREFTATLPNDPTVLEHFAPMGARWLAAGIGQEREWERNKRVTHLGDQFEASLDTQAAGLLAQPDAANWGAAVADYDSAIDLQDIDGNAKDAMRQMVRAKLTGALFDGMLQQGGFAQVEQALASGKFDAWIGGAEGKARWLDRAEAGRAAVQRQEEAAAAAAQRSAKEGLRTIAALIDAGEPVAQGDIEKALATARGAGVADADLIEFASLGRTAAERGAVLGMETPELESNLTALRAKRRAGTATADEVRQSATLEAELKARDEKAGDGLKDLIGTGPTGQMQAARQLGSMTPERRWAAAREAGDERVAVYANLTPNGQRFATEGRVLRTEREADFYPPKPAAGPGGGRAGADAMFKAMLGAALVDQLGGTYAEHLDAALDLMAGTARRWDEPNFRRAVHQVFGQTNRHAGGQVVPVGGLGRVRGRTVELPPLWTEGEFDRAFSRLPFAGAVYGDGKPADAADVRQHFTPRYIGDDNGESLYQLIGPDGRWLGRKGANGATDRFVLRFRKNP